MGRTQWSRRYKRADTVEIRILGFINIWGRRDKRTSERKSWARLSIRTCNEWTSVCKTINQTKTRSENQNSHAWKRKLIDATNNKHATAKLDWVLADKTSSYTVAKKKSHWRSPSRKRAANPYQIRLQSLICRKVWTTSTQASLSKTGTAFSPTALSRIKIFPNKSQ